MISLPLHLDNYLRLRRQLGFKLVSAGLLLRQFLDFAQQQQVPFITTKVALAWATQPRNLSLARRASRLGLVRRFAEYVSAFDPRTEVPPRKLLPFKSQRRSPHLYREPEVVRLIEATREIDSANEFKGASYATVFGLLAATGLRIGEALGLERKDVDLPQALLTIRRAKGNQSRWVPLHPSAQQALQRYVLMRDQAFPQPLTSRFFVSEKGTPMRQVTAHRWFVLVACCIGLRRPGQRRGPRLHDLRHWFAVRTLHHWYRSQTDVEAHLPELATYLGHAHVSGTYWYLSACPELLKLATLRCERAQRRRP
jgi:integrase/recombinase XerD